MTIRFFIIIDIVNCYYLVFKISFGKALQKWGVLFLYIVKMLYI